MYLDISEETGYKDFTNSIPFQWITLTIYEGVIETPLPLYAPLNTPNALLSNRFMYESENKTGQFSENELETNTKKGNIEEVNKPDDLGDASFLSIKTDTIQKQQYASSINLVIFIASTSLRNQVYEIDVQRQLNLLRLKMQDIVAINARSITIYRNSIG